VNVPERIAALRALMSENNLQAYLVPSADQHQSEYVAETWQRRKFISGFDGSAGAVVVTADHAGLWTDSRYFVVAPQQLAGSGIELHKQGEADVEEIEPWLAKQLKSGDRVGLDPKVFSLTGYTNLANELGPAGIELAKLDPDLVEKVWGADRPGLPDKPIRVHPEKYAGQSAADKIARLQKALAETGAQAQVLCALDEIAWLLNLRGADVAYNPVFIAYVIVYQNSASVFVDPAKLDDQVRAGLPSQLKVSAYEQIGQALKELGEKKAKVWLDPTSCSRWVADQLESSGAELQVKASRLPGWKAAKNEVEIAGMRAAHLRDGLAMVGLLYWLEQNVAQGLTELDIVEKIKSLRSQNKEFIGSSFGTISAYGPHGAIVHYRVDAESNVEIKPEGILLIDSGGQYQDGTTDITRTLALAEPTSEQKQAYTAVLKGHLLLTRSQFLKGADGYQLDVLARAPLWALGLNYGHGTGHGVGAALCVHEGPFQVSHRKVLVPMQVGNILSIEPGFYKEGEFGMRIENLALVVEKQQTESGTFLGFETLSLCPYHRSLIDLELLSSQDRRQVDAYHKRVHQALSGKLGQAEAGWLEQATRPL